MMKKKITIGCMAVGIIGISLFLFIAASGSGDIVIVCSKDVPVNSLTKDEVKSIFLGEKVKWDDSHKITFVLLMTETHDRFLEKYLGTNPAQYLQYWKKMIFTGKAGSPKSFKEPDKLIEYIAGTEGAVGYVPSEAYNDKVKTISVR